MQMPEATWRYYGSVWVTVSKLYIRGLVKILWDSKLRIFCNCQRVEWRYYVKDNRHSEGNKWVSEAPMRTFWVSEATFFGMMCQREYSGVILVSEVTLSVLYECEKSRWVHLLRIRGHIKVFYQWQWLNFRVLFECLRSHWRYYVSVVIIMCQRSLSIICEDQSS